MIRSRRSGGFWLGAPKRRSNDGLSDRYSAVVHAKILAKIASSPARGTLQTPMRWHPFLLVTKSSPSSGGGSENYKKRGICG